MGRIPASEWTRESLKALMTGHSEIADGRSELVRLAARLIIEEALEEKRGTRWVATTTPAVRRPVPATATAIGPGG